MSKLLLSRPTQLQTKAFLAHPSHALLITGQVGSGKYYLARQLAWQLLGLESEVKLGSYPYFHHIASSDGKKEITIEVIRDLISQLKLKATASSKIGRVVIIENAQLVSHEAQNALLKSLEETPRDTVFILTTPTRNLLLPTVASRLQELAVTSPSLSQTIKLYEGQYSVSALTSAWKLSSGGVGLLSALLNEDRGHPLKQAVEDFKSLLKEAPGTRLARLDKLERDDLALLLEAGSRIVAILHNDTVVNHKTGQAQRLLKARKRLLNSKKQLQKNVATRLVALDLALGLEV